MGLDMYLYLRKEDYKSSFDNKIGLYPEELRNFEKDILNRNFASKSIKICYQVGYWRKANAIHKWFVDVCADGNDDCSPVYVRLDNLQELQNLCKEVLKNKEKASELLPTESGFFFGTTEYDEWYFKDIAYTIEIIDKIIDFMKKPEAEDYDVVYQASW